VEDFDDARLRAVATRPRMRAWLASGRRLRTTGRRLTRMAKRRHDPLQEPETPIATAVPRPSDFAVFLRQFCGRADTFMSGGRQYMQHPARGKTARRSC